ncbi:hypothetical protein AgCh_032093 [Apium graveolens]
MLNPPVKGELDIIELINLDAAELELKEKKKKIDARIAQGAKGETLNSNELNPIVVLKPKPSSFTFSNKYLMEFDYSPPRPDEQKLMDKLITSFNTTKDAALRNRIVRIYRHGEMICIMNGHPKFVEEKKEEALRIKSQSKKRKKQLKLLNWCDNLFELERLSVRQSIRARKTIKMN